MKIKIIILSYQVTYHVYGSAGHRIPESDMGTLFPVTNLNFPDIWKAFAAGKVSFAVNFP